MKPRGRVRVLLIAAVCAWGCASTQVIPLGPDQASRDFLVGEWEGTYDWPSDVVTTLKRVTLTIETVGPSGTVSAVVQLFDSTNSPGLGQTLLCVLL